MHKRFIRFLFLLCVSTAACNDAVDLNGGTSEVFISGNAVVDSSCRPTVDQWLGAGKFDIGNSSGGRCSQPYVMNLIVNSESDDLMLFDEAEVSLRDPSSGALIDMASSSSGTLANPYKMLASGRITRKAREGVVPVQVIPPTYAPFLRDFKNKNIAVEVRLSGVTQSGGRVATQEFRFPVTICEGCLTICRSVIPEGATTQDIYGDECADDSGADGRVCVESGC